MRRPATLGVVALLAAVPLLARAGDGGTASTGDGGTPLTAIHVSVAEIAFTGKASPAVRETVEPARLARALCAGLQTRPGVACLTRADAIDLAKMQGLRGLLDGCGGGPCAGSTRALTSPDDLVQVTVEVRVSGYVLHLRIYHPPAVTPVYRADVPAPTTGALRDAARAEAKKAAAHLAGA